MTVNHLIALCEFARAPDGKYLVWDQQEMRVSDNKSKLVTLKEVSYLAEKTLNSKNLKEVVAAKTALEIIKNRITQRSAQHWFSKILKRLPNWINRIYCILNCQKWRIKVAEELIQRMNPTIKAATDHFSRLPEEVITRHVLPYLNNPHNLYWVNRATQNVLRKEIQSQIKEINLKIDKIVTELDSSLHSDSPLRTFLNGLKTDRTLKDPKLKKAAREKLFYQKIYNVFCEYNDILQQAGKELALAIVSTNGTYLQHLSSTLQQDEGVVLAAVKQNGHALRFAAEALKNDKNFVLAAVKLDGCALQHTSDTLRNDKTLALAAIQSNVNAFEYISPDLQQQGEMIFAAAMYFITSKISRSNWLCGQERLVLAAVKIDGLALEQATEHLRSSEAIATAAVTQNGLALQYHIYHQQGFDREYCTRYFKIAMAAVKQNGMAIQYVEFKQLGWTPLERREHYKEIVQVAVAQNPSATLYTINENEKDRWL